MAFASNPIGAPGGNTLAESGPELSDVFTNEVGFKGVSGDCNIRFLPTPWPADALPAPTCSLLAVASTKGVVVGAGPDCLVVSRTEAVRKAIAASTGEEKIKTKPFEPQAKIPLPARPTHVTFCSGDNAFLLAMENATQVSVYETASLSQGNAQPAFSISTNGITLRTVVPNPAPPEDAHSPFVALVTATGDLLMANLQTRNLVSGTTGPVLKNGVSCVSWSNKGKQLVAGLGDGTAYQMTPEGVRKDEIPRPPDLEPNCHVSSISWLENDMFLIIYTSNAVEDDMGSIPPSSYYIVTRRKQAPFLFQKLPELCFPYGMKRTPAYQFIARLRDFKPHLKDLLILSSTASTDIGLITRSDQPLSEDDAAQQTTGLFATTELSDDTRRAALPLTESAEETSAIGLGMDLSSTENVAAPIPGEEISESSTPLPNLLLLNNDGIMCSWWFVYSPSIRQKMGYQGLSSVNPQAQQVRPQPQQPSFAQPFGTPSPLGAQPGFGKPPATPAFGSPSPLGANRQSTFGAPSTIGGGPSFGTPSMLRSSFGTPSALGHATPQFGKSGFGTMGSTTPLGQSSTPGLSSIPASGGGFGSYANTGGFAGLAASKPTENPFGKPAAESPFSILSGPSSVGLQADTSTAFTPQKPKESTGFGLGPGGFVLGSTFKGDGSAVNDDLKPEKPSGLFSLGDVDEMVSTPTKASPPTAAMDDMEDELTKGPTLTLLGPTPVEPSARTPSPFDTQMKAEETATAVPENIPVAETPKKEQSVEGLPLPPDSTSKTSFGPGDASASSIVSRSLVEHAPLPPDFVKQPKPSPKPVAELPLPPDFTNQPEPSSKPVAEPPLPPDFTKQPKPSLKPVAEPPLPPEFVTPIKKAERPETAVENVPLLPEPRPNEDETGPIPDGSVKDESEAEAEESEAEAEVSEAEENISEEEEAEESDFADSGEEITHEFSPTEEEPELRVQSLKTSPESSFGGLLDRSPAGGLFSRITKPDKAQQRQPRELFGEVTKPVLRPPTSEVPRSPSPIRAGASRELFRPESQRSKSAPTRPGHTLAARKAALMESAKRDGRLEPLSSSIAREEQARYIAEAQRQAEEEALSLSDDDEDERLRADLARPLEPVPTLDPFLPHQDYTGGTSKPGIPGQIERLYRDINSMVDTLGINSRSLLSYLLYQRSSKDSDYEKYVEILHGDQPTDIMDEKLLFSDIEKLDDLVAGLADTLEQQRVQGVEEKLEQCRSILSKDILTLRGQCASLRRTLDAHTDPASILSAPLSAEQANLQQDLRSASTAALAKLSELEQGVSLLRAKIADSPTVSKSATKRPTVEAVKSTIANMMSMAESKSSDIDVLEAKMKRLGIDVSGLPPAGGREGTPFTTPKKALGRYPTTPGSRGSADVPITAYHTPDSAGRSLAFRSSVNGSAKKVSRLREVEATDDLVIRQGMEKWKTKAQRRKHLVESLRRAMDEKESKVRSVDDL